MRLSVGGWNNPRTPLPEHEVLVPTEPPEAYHSVFHEVKRNFTAQPNVHDAKFV